MARPRLLDLDRVSFRLTIGTLAGIAFFFLIFPTAIVLLTSFTSTASLRFPPPGYSLRWYASLSLGAGRFFTFRRVTLPLIGRGIAAGAFLAFMASFDNVPVSLFLTDPRTEVLPIHLWQIIDTDLDVRTAAASGLLIVATVVLMVAAERFAGLSKQLH